MRHNGTSRTRTGVIRHAALLVALLSLSGQVLGLAHLLLVRHVVCPEHGELIHIGDSSTGGTDAAAQHEHSGNGYQDASESAALDGHDHCAVSTLRHAQPSLRQAPEALDQPATPTPIVRVARAIASPSRVSILLLAPKASPPALHA